MFDKKINMNTGNRDTVSSVNLYEGMNVCVINYLYNTEDELC